MLIHHGVINHVGHKSPFVSIGHAAMHPNFIPDIIMGPNLLLQSVVILFNHIVSRLYNGLGRAIILFQSINLYIVVVLLEIQKMLLMFAPRKA